MNDRKVEERGGLHSTDCEDRSSGIMTVNMLGTRPKGMGVKNQES